MHVPNPYASKDYRRLIWIPLILLALSFISLFFVKPIQQGIEFRGGILLNAYTSQANPDVEAVKAALAPLSSGVGVRVFDSPSGKGLEIQLGNSEKLDVAEQSLKKLHADQREYTFIQLNISRDTDLAAAGDTAASQRLDSEKTRLAELSSSLPKDSASLLSLVGSSASLPPEPEKVVAVAETEFGKAKQEFREKILAAVKSAVAVKDYSFKEVGASLSSFFFKKVLEIMLWSFLLSSIAILAIFRSLRPSFIVVFAAVADIVITLAVMPWFGIPLTLASAAALFMLIGFSLDTDMLLTIRVTKRAEGTPAHRAYEAMKTGFMMNLCTITSFGVLFFLSQYLQIDTYAQIGAVAVIGAFADFVATWCFNAVVILDYGEKLEAKRQAKFGQTT